MTKRDRRDRRRKTGLKKETIRKLDRPSLDPADLAKVHGGKQPYTAICLTIW